MCGLRPRGRHVPRGQRLTVEVEVLGRALLEPQPVVIRRVLHGAKGAREEFVTQAGPGYEWRDIYVNEGVEEVALPGRTVRAARLAHERIGINSNTYRSVVTQWKELSTGMIVHQEYRALSGRAVVGAAWRATSVSGLP